MKNDREYFAFISYQRKDEAMAKRLQHTLEYYKLPVAVIEKEPELKDGVRPIFVDMTELGDEPFLTEAIEKALKGSRFLIVVCSPRSAKSKWVNKEVQYFIKLKRTKRIVPFIIEGEPNADVEIEECCTPLIQKLLGKRELLGINVNEMGFDAAAVKVVSRMFHISFRSLWNRYEKDKEEEQRKIKEQNDRLLVSQSRFVAEKAKSIIEDDSYLAKLLAIEVLPKDLNCPDRPYVPEAEALLRRVVGHNSAVLRVDRFAPSATFSLDGKFIFSACGKLIRIWDAESGAILNDMEGHASLVLTVAFSSNGKRIVSASVDETVRVWDAESRVLLTTLHVPMVISAALNPDGERVVTTSYDGFVRIWDVDTGAELKTLKGSHDGVFVASFSSDGKRIVSPSSDNTIRIWDSESGVELGVLEGHSYWALSAVFSVDGSRVASCSSDETIRIWNSESGAELKVLKGHTSPVYSVAFSPDGKSVVSTSWDNNVRVWDIETGAEIKVLEGHEGRVYSAVFSPDGKRIVSASSDETIRIWEMDNDFGFKELRGHTSFVESIAVSSDGKRIVSGSSDNTCRIWDFESGANLCVLKGHTSWVYSVAFSPDGKRIASASSDETIRIWDPVTGTELKVLKGHSSIVYSVAFSPDGRFVVSTSADDTIRIWDVDSATELLVLKGNSRSLKMDGDSDFHTFSVFYASFDMTGKRVVSIAGDNKIKVWDIKSGEILNEMYDRNKRRGHVVFSKSGSQIVSVGESVIVWDIESGKEIGALETSFPDIQSTLISPDGRCFISPCRENDISVADVVTGIELMLLEGHSEQINSLVFHPDGKHIVSASNDGTIRIWDFPPLQDLIDQTLERFKDRPLTSEERRLYYLE